MPPTLVTGAAGFIGFHLAKALLDRGDVVLGVDSMVPYYDVRLKEARLAQLTGRPGFTFERLDLADREATSRLFERGGFGAVVHLAAQPGVRYSLENPHAYVDANVTGFLDVLEGCRRHPVRHLVYASSSSVYGGNTKVPFAVTDNVDHPVSLYAATKKANELMAYTYSHLFAIPATGLRFFTVYGPWGRPDMAPMLFARAILEGQPIKVFNHGQMRRDFTYVDDIVEGVIRVLDRPPAAGVVPPHRLYNIGNSQPVELLRFIDVMEAALGKKAVRELLPMQPGDVPATFADVSDLERDVGFRPATSIEEGVRRFVAWYRAYHRA
ncbi:NAD-dependent epimerase/dehydratase [Anaeromyxobacter dehalogenans 2CP-1]|uniref:NAD-dependent epimerase/dehydratase n=1 Tax=Anaeromyxobacter dehalogenans (strain ATCC BAA-258 / DSM 21875 / 2CP-1) TaxID=455488 RepID=B8J904_ANAD2|nr:NAD-dependent epimerase [Anaeromyxobacter dehalogenans]ACL63602.1 NAD-dependent epimerase/dehydratase [Anaeromyxobacter dehalogenans 2CP-1]